MLKKNWLGVLFVAMLTVIATPVFAEDAAPVYDADNYPASFDGQADQGESELSPPAPVSVPQQSMSQRLSQMEQQINNLQHSEVSSKLEALQSEVQSLRGQVEQLTHQIQQRRNQPTAKPETNSAEVQALRDQVTELSQQIEQLHQTQNQQRSVFLDLNKRVNDVKSANLKNPTLSNAASLPEETATPKKNVLKIKSKSEDALEAVADVTKVKNKESKTEVTAPPTLSVAEKKTLASQPNVAEEQQIYQTAYDLIKVKKYNEAINALQKMLQKYPSGQFAANAHYWLGELYGLLGKNDQAGVEFDTVVNNFPDSPKVSDAQLKLGLIYAAQFKWPDAKAAFKKVINHFPGTSSSRLAAEQLKQIRQAGH